MTPCASQSDFFNTHPSVTVLPVTRELRDVTVARETIGASFGQPDADTMRGVERRLAVFLGTAK